MENNLLENKITSEGIAETYSGGGYIKLNVHSPIVDKSLIEGKYSPRFVEELRRQISFAIERELSVGNVEDSSLEIYLVFAPGTYMEHIVDGVTYRRLLITARACSARDLWIKWRNLKSSEPLTVSSDVTEDGVLFELGEDVPQKIKEKEYRFLIRTSPSEYQLSMGRKNITAWREIIKRELKRGALTKSEAVVTGFETAVKETETAEEKVLSEKDADTLTEKLQEALASYTVAEETVTEQPATTEEINSDINAMLKNLLGVTEPEVTVTEEKEFSEEFVLDGELEIESFSEFSEETVTDDTLNNEEEILCADDLNLMRGVSEEIKPEEEKSIALDLEEELRLKIEAEYREKYEREAREKIEAETEKYRRMSEELAKENERLKELLRLAEEAKEAESEKLKSEIEARDNAEKRERERMAELARLALIEEQRLETDRLEREREAKREENVPTLKPEIVPTQETSRVETKNCKYISKNARLLFRRPVDPAITKRIHEIILTTIKYFHKEDVYIKIKATIPDLTTVNLEFVKIPEEETELLVNIIKVLGKSDLGIFKVYLE